jgi:CheY-like chemotaxis protein
MDGIELAARIRAGAGPRPLLIVATTALGDPESLARTALAGFHYHLVKPIDSARLREVLDQFRALLKLPTRPAPPSDENTPDEARRE